MISLLPHFPCPDRLHGGLWFTGEGLGGGPKILPCLLPTCHLIPETKSSYYYHDVFPTTDAKWVSGCDVRLDVVMLDHKHRVSIILLV